MLGAPDGNLFEQYVQYLGALFQGDFGVSYTYFPVHGHAHDRADAAVDRGPGRRHPDPRLHHRDPARHLGGLPAQQPGRLGHHARVDVRGHVAVLLDRAAADLRLRVHAALVPERRRVRRRQFARAGTGSSSPTRSSTACCRRLSLLITGPIGWIIGMRNNMVQSLGEDYTRLARGEGPAGPADRAHLRRRGSRSCRTSPGSRSRSAASSAARCWSSTVFNYPGMGRLLLEAVSNRDFPLMQAIFLFTTVGVLIANLVADLLYGFLDPRVRKGATT